MQRAIEQRGAPTVSITVARDITERAKPPRAVFVPFMMGHHFGVPFHSRLQRRIILEALSRLQKVGESGEIYDLPLSWAQARREGIEIERAMGLRH
ncbi:MAG: hypothetical protein M3Q29_07930 [Chloroflexota bacterium]|nr:hypothetical protein [Chloroflexota bacterium]